MPRVLLIDNDVITREIHNALLCQHGFEVHIAGDVRAAWDKLQSNPPDVAVLDLVMPDTQGLDFLRKIRAHDTLKNLPILVYTGMFVPAVVEEAKEAGATRMFDKTFISAATLLDAVNECLVSRQVAA